MSSAADLIRTWTTTASTRQSLLSHDAIVFRASGWIILFVLFTFLSACNHKYTRPNSPESGRHTVHRPNDRSHSNQDAAPGVPVDVSRIPEPVPRLEPRSKYGNHSPYTVFGRNYSVLPSASGYVERGIASWYGTKFHGRPTSSREPYDMYKLTAAHKTLPIPAYVRVTNLENGKNLIVRVNDRGPFHENRIIDLSYAAAVRLGIQAKGTGLVEVRAIDPAHSGQDSSAAQSNNDDEHRIYIQVGAFDDRDNAQRMKQRLKEAGFRKVILDRVRVRNKLLHRVRIGPARDTDAADAIVKRLAEMGLSSRTLLID